MSAESSGTAGGPGGQDRRKTGEQRRYNRRSPVSDISPPYYETFERIALALERIEGLLERLTTTGPVGVPAEEPRRGVVPPARGSSQP